MNIRFGIKIDNKDKNKNKIINSVKKIKELKTLLKKYNTQILYRATIERKYYKRYFLPN